MFALILSTPSPAQITDPTGSDFWNTAYMALFILLVLGSVISMIATRHHAHQKSAFWILSRLCLALDAGFVALMWALYGFFLEVKDQFTREWNLRTSDNLPLTSSMEESSQAGI